MQHLVGDEQQQQAQRDSGQPCRQNLQGSGQAGGRVSLSSGQPAAVAAQQYCRAPPPSNTQRRNAEANMPAALTSSPAHTDGAPRASRTAQQPGTPSPHHACCSCGSQPGAAAHLVDVAPRHCSKNRRRLHDHYQVPINERPLRVQRVRLRQGGASRRRWIGSGRSGGGCGTS